MITTRTEAKDFKFYLMKKQYAKCQMGNRK